MRFLAKFYFILSAQFGVDPRKALRSFFGLPKYLLDLIRFRSTHTGRVCLLPCLHDWYEEGGATKSEYFWQDLVVARMIFDAKPERHVDIGSRVDGFVAHVASYREIEVFDVRQISTHVPGVVFRQADLMNSSSLPINSGGGYCDSLSCLHAIEHFGLGRYGDPINPQGYQQGIANMAQLLQPGGTFYLSTPIGQERVEFNANWVFDPRSILRRAEAASMELKKLIVISPENGPQETAVNSVLLADLALAPYQLGLFIFAKRKS
jgi:hypothetical protein